MQFDDVVTVKNPVEACDSGYDTNPIFHMMPGMPGVVRNCSEDGIIRISIPYGPKHRLGISWLFTAPQHNVVLIAKQNATSFSTKNVDPNYIDQACKFLQTNMKKKACQKMAGMMNEIHAHHSGFDRWGRCWTLSELANEAAARANQMSGNWGENYVTALNSTCLTLRLTPENPTKKPEPKERGNRRTRHCYVNVYNEDRHYKGSMEGGTWRDEEWPVESLKVSRKAANQLLRAKTREYALLDEGTPPISSVASQGKHIVRMENFSNRNVFPPPFVYE